MLYWGKKKKKQSNIKEPALCLKMKVILQKWRWSKRFALSWELNFSKSPQTNRKFTLFLALPWLESLPSPLTLMQTIMTGSSAFALSPSCCELMQCLCLLISDTQWRWENPPHDQKHFFLSLEKDYLMSHPIHLDTFLWLLCFKIAL